MEPLWTIDNLINSIEIREIIYDKRDIPQYLVDWAINLRAELEEGKPTPFTDEEIHVWFGYAIVHKPPPFNPIPNQSGELTLNDLSRAFEQMRNTGANGYMSAAVENMSGWWSEYIHKIVEDL